MYLGHIVAAGHHTAGFNAHAGHDGPGGHRVPDRAEPVLCRPGCALAGIRTVPYTLKKGETVAQAHGLTVPQLKKLNGLRTFARGFDHLQAGDELDVPAVPLTGGKGDNNRHDARGPFAADRENEDAQAQQMAGMASQAGSFLASHPDVRPPPGWLPSLPAV